MGKSSKSRAIDNLIKAIKGDTDIQRIISSSSTTKSLNDLVDYIKENGVGGSGKCEGVEVYANLKSGDSDNSKTLQDIFRVLKPLAVSGNKFTVYIPEGTYYFDYPLSPYSNISIRGAGIGKTILKTRGTGGGYALFQNVKETDDKLIENVVYSDMTIDGSEFEFNGTYNSNAKGIFFTNVKDSIFERIKFVGTGSTALGIDFLENVFIDKIICENCGRLWTMLNGVEGPGGAGIGIGTGAREEESFTISNCICNNCGHYGIFVEHQEIFNSSYNKEAKGSLIVKNGRFNGIGIRGGQNIHITNCTSYRNTNYGIYMDCGEDSTLGLSLKYIKVANNTVTENKNGIGLAGNAWLSVLDINNNIVAKNTNMGIDLGYTKSASSVLVSQKYIKVSDNNIALNKYGLYVNTVANMEGLSIGNSNEFNENTYSCGNLYLTNTKSYAELATSPFSVGLTTIKLHIKTPSSITEPLCLISCKDQSYSSTSTVKGWGILLKENGDIEINIVGENGDDTRIYKSIYKPNLLLNTEYTFSIVISNNKVLLRVFDDNESTTSTYTQYERDATDSTGNESSFIWILQQNVFINGNIQLGRMWNGSNGYKNYAQGLVLYQLLTYSDDDGRQVVEFNNVGENKMILTDRGVIGTLHNGAKQMCNKL